MGAVSNGTVGRARHVRRGPRLVRLAASTAVAAGLAGGLGACSSGDDGESSSMTVASLPPGPAAPGNGDGSSPASSAPAGTESGAASTTSTPVSSSIGAPGLVEDCAVLAPIAADASRRSSFEADVDDDGAPDQLDSYAVGANPTAGDWHLRVTLAAGGGSDISLREDPAPGAVQVLGTVYIGSTVEPGAGGRRPAIFVWNGSGASARTIGLYRVDGCELTPMTAPAGGPAGFVVGASVGHQEGLRCDADATTSLVVEVLSEPDVSGTGYAVTRRTYSRSGNALVEAAGPQVTTEAAPPAEAGQILGCGDITVPR